MATQTAAEPEQQPVPVAVTPTQNKKYKTDKISLLTEGGRGNRALTRRKTQGER